MAEIIAFPARGTAPRVSPEVRAYLEHAAQTALDAADKIIGMLDEMDGDPGEEDGGDGEPSLGAPEGHVVQIGWARGSDSDRERDSAPCA